MILPSNLGYQHICIARENLQLSKTYMATTDEGSRKKFIQRLLPSWVAPWLTVPQLVVKALQLTFAVVTVAVIVSWRPAGFTFKDFVAQAEDGAPTIAVLCVACISQIYVLAMVVIGFVGVSIPPHLRTIIAGFFLLLWVITLPILSSQITLLKYNSIIRILEVSFTQLEVAVVLGFLAMFSFLVDVLTGLIALNKYHHKRFSKTDMTTKAT